MRMRGALLLGAGQLLQDARATAVVLKVVMMVMQHHISWLRSQKIQHLVVEPVRWVHQLSKMVLWSRWNAVYAPLCTKCSFPLCSGQGHRERAQQVRMLELPGSASRISSVDRSTRTSTESSRCALDHELGHSSQY